MTTKPVRALCDTGSQLNMVTEACIKDWSLPTYRSPSYVVGFNSQGPVTFTRKTKAWLLSRFDDKQIMPISFTVVPNIMLQARFAAPPHIQMPDDIKDKLADANYQKSEPVSVLLGAGIWARAALPGSMRQSNGLVAQQMSFGWIIFGSTIAEHPTELFTGAVEMVDSEIDHLEAHLHRLWEIEDILQEKPLTPEHTQCEEYFAKTHSRSPSGRYIVRIPMKSEITGLGASRETALKRFYQLERRLQGNAALREQYVSVINDYIDRGHLQLADRPADPLNYYVPHHCVLKKFRVVFDGSCRTTTGRSFNDIQLIGGKLQDDLIDLVVRFRWHAVAITADVK